MCKKFWVKLKGFYLLFRQKSARLERRVAILGQVFCPLALPVEHADKVGRVVLLDRQPVVIDPLLLNVKQEPRLVEAEVDDLVQDVVTRATVSGNRFNVSAFKI